MELMKVAVTAGCVLLAVARGANGQVVATIVAPPQLLSDLNPTALVQYADGSVLPLRSQGGAFPLAAGVAGGTSTLQLRIPAALASRLVIQSLDGAVVTAHSPVAADGTTTFQISFGSQPGLYRIQIGLAGRSAQLQFWIPSPGGNNPAVVAGGTR